MQKKTRGEYREGKGGRNMRRWRCVFLASKGGREGVKMRTVLGKTEVEVPNCIRKIKITKIDRTE